MKKHRAIRLLIIFILLSVFVYFYINKIFLPVNIKSLLQTRISKALDRPAILESIAFRFPKGVTIRGIKIFRKDQSDQIFASAEEISFHFIFPNLFKTKSLIIPSAEIVSPSLNLIKLKNNGWNYSDIFTADTSSEKNDKNFQILCKNIVIKQGRISFTDEEGKRADGLSEINADVNITLTGKIQAKVSAKQDVDKSLSLKGEFNPAAKTLEAKLSLRNFSPLPYAEFFNAPHAKLTNGTFSAEEFNILHADGAVKTSGDLRVAGYDTDVAEARVKTDFFSREMTAQWQNGRLEASCPFEIQNADVSAVSLGSFQGNISSQGLKLDFEDGTFHLLGGLSVRDTPQQKALLKIKDITARGAFDLSSLSLETINKRTKISGTLSGEALQLSFPGEVTIDTDVSAEINSLEISAEELLAQGGLLLNNTLMKNREREFNGSIALKNLVCSLKGKEFQLYGNTSITNAVLKLDAFKKISGNFSSVNTNLTFKDSAWNLQSDFILNNAFIDWDMQTSLSADIQSENTTFFMGPDGYGARSSLKLQNAKGIFSDRILTGNPEIRLTFNTSLSGEKPVSLEGSARFSGAALENVPRLETVSGITGELAFTQQDLSSDNLSFQALGTDFLSSFRLSDFQKPDLEASLKAQNISLGTVFQTFPEIKEKTGLTVQGNADIQADYNGPLKEFDKEKLNARAAFQNLTLTQKNLPSAVTNFSGNIHYGGDKIIWNSLSGTYANETYTLNGRLEDISRPTVFSDIQSKNLNASVQTNILRKAFQLIVCKGTFFQSSWDIIGDVHLEDAGPRLDIKGSAELNLGDFRHLPIKGKDRLLALEPRGTITLENLLFQGYPSQWRDWNLTFKAQSPSFSIMKHTLKDLSLSYTQRDRNISKCVLSSEIYDGALNADLSFDLEDSLLPMEGSAEIKNLQLKNLRKQGGARLANMSGLLDMDCDIKGPARDINRLKGQGTAEIHEGYFEIFNEMYSNQVFTDIAADFTISDGKVATQNMLAMGQEVSLKAKGWIDFQKNINFDIIPVYNNAAIKTSFGSINPGMIIKDSLAFKVTGTVDQPRYKAVAQPAKLLKNTSEVIGDVFKEGINILDSLF